jgi:type 1 glutamine amidotransferase
VTLLPAARADDGVRHIKALFICGGCCHDYDHQKHIVTEGISKTAGDKVQIDWTIADDGNRVRPHKAEVYKDPNWYKGFDIVVHDECFGEVTDTDFIAGILKAHGEGKVPAVNLHCTMHSYKASGTKWTYRDWYEFTGIESHNHGAQMPIALKYIDHDHPISAGLGDWTTVKEELYNNFEILPTAHPLLRGKQSWTDKKSGAEQSADYVVAWTNLYRGTRVFSTTLGHDNQTCADPRYLTLVTRGFLWALGITDLPAPPAEQK